MRTHTITVTERELRVILTAFDVCREGVALHTGPWRWWNETQYVTKLYERLRSEGL